MICPGLIAHALSGHRPEYRMLPEVRMARIIDAIRLRRRKRLSCGVEAGELLGLSERHFRRLRDAYEAHGAEGLLDRRRGRMSGRRAPVDEIEWVVEEFRSPNSSRTAATSPIVASGTAFATKAWTTSCGSTSASVPLLMSFSAFLDGSFDGVSVLSHWRSPPVRRRPSAAGRRGRGTSRRRGHH